MSFIDTLKKDERYLEFLKRSDNNPSYNNVCKYLKTLNYKGVFEREKSGGWHRVWNPSIESIKFSTVKGDSGEFLLVEVFLNFQAYGFTANNGHGLPDEKIYMKEIFDKDEVAFIISSQEISIDEYIFVVEEDEEK